MDHATLTQQFSKCRIYAGGVHECLIDLRNPPIHARTLKTATVFFPRHAHNAQSLKTAHAFRSNEIDRTILDTLATLIGHEESFAHFTATAATSAARFGLPESASLAATFNDEVAALAFTLTGLDREAALPRIARLSDRMAQEINNNPAAYRAMATPRPAPGYDEHLETLSAPGDTAPVAAHRYTHMRAHLQADMAGLYLVHAQSVLTRAYYDIALATGNGANTPALHARLEDSLRHAWQDADTATRLYPALGTLDGFPPPPPEQKKTGRTPSGLPAVKPKNP